MTTDMDISIMSEDVVSKPGFGEVFRRAWWIALIGTVGMAILGVFCAAVVAYVMPKKYDSVAVIDVKPVSGQSEGLSNAEAAVVVEVMRSSKCLTQVSDHLELPNRWGISSQEIVDRLRKTVTIRHEAGTGIFKIVVLDTNKEDVRDIADELANVYRGMAGEQSPKGGGVTIIDRPVIAAGPSSPKVNLILGSGLGLGLLGGLLLSVPLMYAFGRKSRRPAGAPPVPPKRSEEVSF